MLALIDNILLRCFSLQRIKIKNVTLLICLKLIIPKFLFVSSRITILYHFFIVLWSNRRRFFVTNRCQHLSLPSKLNARPPKGFSPPSTCMCCRSLKIDEFRLRTKVSQFLLNSLYISSFQRGVRKNRGRREGIICNNLVIFPSFFSRIKIISV